MKSQRFIRMLACLLTLAMLFSVLPAAAFADSDQFVLLEETDEEGTEDNSGGQNRQDTQNQYVPQIQENNDQLVMPLNLEEEDDGIVAYGAGVVVNDITFPDPVFRQYVLDNCDLNGDGVLDDAEITGVTSIDVHEMGISNLKGIENFVYLLFLDCSYNDLTELDVTNNTQLYQLLCDGNQLTSLDLSNTLVNPSMPVSYTENGEVILFSNKDNSRTFFLSADGTFDFSALPGFDINKAFGFVGGTVENGILTPSQDTVTYYYGSEADDLLFTLVFDNFAAAFFDVPDGNIAIDENNFPYDYFRQYVLDNIDTDKDGYLNDTEIAGTTVININNNLSPSSFENTFTLKGIEYFTNLQELYCDGNRLAELDLSANTNLRKLVCGRSWDYMNPSSYSNGYGNSLTYLDLSSNPYLEYLNCSSNELISLNISNNSELTYIDCSYNGRYNSDNYRDIIGFSSLDLSNKPKLTYLDCHFNTISSLDLSSCSSLEFLNCAYNKLSSLDLSNNLALTNLICDYNDISYLNLTNNTSLTNISCGVNQLSSLDISKNTALLTLYCYANKLTSLDISNNPNLRILNCSGNLLSKLDTSNNPYLSDIICRMNLLATLDTDCSTVDGGGNTYSANLSEDGTFDFNTIPGFDVSRLADVKGAEFISSSVIKPSTYQITYYYYCNSKKNSYIEVTLSFENYYDEQRKNGDWTTETFSGPVDVAVYNSENQVIARAQNGNILQVLPSLYDGVSILYKDNGDLLLSRDKSEESYIIVTGNGYGTMNYTNGDNTSFSNIKIEPGKMLQIDGVDGTDTQISVYVITEGAVYEVQKAYTVDENGNETAVGDGLIEWTTEKITGPVDVAVYDANGQIISRLPSVDGLTNLSFEEQIQWNQNYSYYYNYAKENGVMLSPERPGIYFSGNVSLNRRSNLKTHIIVTGTGNGTFTYTNGNTTFSNIAMAPEKMLLIEGVNSDYEAINVYVINEGINNFDKTHTVDNSGVETPINSPAPALTAETISGSVDIAIYNADNQVIARVQNGEVLQVVPVAESGVSLTYDKGVISLSRRADADTHIIVTGTGNGTFTYTNGNITYSNIAMAPEKMLLIEGVNSDYEAINVYVINEGINNFDKTHIVDTNGNETPINPQPTPTPTPTPEALTPIDATVFPDANFRQWVADNADTDKDGKLSKDEIAAVTVMDISSNKIFDLRGIEIFENLADLDCSSNSLSCFDVSQNALLAHCSYGSNARAIRLADDGTFDLSTIPGFDVSKIVELSGGEVAGTMLKPEKSFVAYKYDCGQGYVPSFYFTILNPIAMIPKDGTWTNDIISDDVDFAVYSSDGTLMGSKIGNTTNLNGCYISRNGNNFVVNRPVESGSYIIITGTDDGKFNYSTELLIDGQSNPTVFNNIEAEPGKVFLVEGASAATEISVVKDKETLEKIGTVNNDGSEIPVEAPVAVLSEATYINSADVHKSYPTGMTVKFVYADGTEKPVPQLQNLLNYDGTSVRLSDPKGIRIITRIDKATRDSLINKGVNGFKLVEYGTAVMTASKYAQTGIFELGADGVKSGYAYCKDAGYDMIFADDGTSIQYTNNLVGWSDAQCGKDLLLRSYSKFRNDAGIELVIYGGVLNRSISYIAEQNLPKYQAGSSEYNFLKSLADTANNAQ